MKIVEFEDGSYAIRCGWFFGWRYLAIRVKKIGWSAVIKVGDSVRPRQDVVDYCKGSKEEIMREWAKRKVKRAFYPPPIDKHTIPKP